MAGDAWDARGAQVSRVFMLHIVPTRKPTSHASRSLPHRVSSAHRESSCPTQVPKSWHLSCVCNKVVPPNNRVLSIATTKNRRASPRQEGIFWRAGMLWSIGVRRSMKLLLEKEKADTN